MRRVLRVPSRCSGYALHADLVGRTSLVKTWILLAVAFRTLRRTPLRSALTVLGVIIGVAAVIVMVSIGEGAKAQVEATLTGLDTNQLHVAPRMPNTRPSGPPPPLPHGEGLTFADYAAIQREVPGLSAASVQAYLSSGNGVKANGRSIEARVHGIDPAGLSIFYRRLVGGSAFGETDVARASSACVVTESVAKRLFPNSNPIGARLRIGDWPFIIIGIAPDNPLGQSSPQQGDLTVFVPYTSLLRRLDRNAPLVFVLRAADPSELGNIQLAVSNLLERRRGMRKVEFAMSNVQEAVRTYMEGSRTMTLLLGAIGGISLLVGGIGIMNVMLVSVTERTHEIGIRMAVGTQEADILFQFLLESTLLSVLGGVIGIGLGLGAAHIATSLYDWPTRVTSTAVLTAFAFSALVGVGFGFYPAHRAAALDPIEALRAE